MAGLTSTPDYMNGNNGNSKQNSKHNSSSTFGVVKNQGRNAFANNNENSAGRARANSVTEAPTRNRANAVFGAPEGFGKIRNEGRQNAQPSNNSSGFGLKEQMQNLGRAAFGKNPDRGNLNFGQKTGFNLVSGFMDKLISEADKSPPDESNKRPGFLQPPGNTGFNPGGDNNDRRRGKQAQPNHKDENVTAGEFFKRLQSAMQDPAKFKRDAQQRQQERASQKSNQPSNEQQQQRQQSGAAKQQQPTAQDFFKELRGALKDPAGYKRRVEAQQGSRQQQAKPIPQEAPKPVSKEQPQSVANKPPPQSNPKPKMKSPRK